MYCDKCGGLMTIQCDNNGNKRVCINCGNVKLINEFYYE